jgi:hypothetical protein
MKLGLAPETGSRENWQWNLLDPQDGCTIATAHRAVCSKLHTFRGSLENALERPKRLMESAVFQSEQYETVLLTLAS